jgi:O-antigen/teichoic acid export membrane protein
VTDASIPLDVRASHSSRFASRVLGASVTSLIIGALGFISGPLVARLLGPEGRGELAAIQAWPLVLSSLSALGLHEATIYFAARDPDRGARFASSATLLALLGCIPVMAIGYVLMPLLLHAQSPEIVATGRLYLLALPLSALSVMPLGLLRGRQDMATWNLLRTLTPLAWLGLLAMAFVMRQGNPHWVAAAFLVVSGGLAIVNWMVVWKRADGGFRPSTADWKPMLHYGLPTMASQTPMALTLRFDQMVLAAFLAPQALGLYAVAVAWSNAMGPVLSGVGYVIFPMVAAQQDSAGQRAMLGHGTRLGVALALPAALALGALAPIAIPHLFGQDYAAAVPASLVLVLAAAVANTNGILRDGARGLGATGAVLVSEIVGLVAGILALALLLKPWGIIGASVAALTGYTAGTVSLLVAIRRRTGSTVGELLVPRRHDAAEVIALLRQSGAVRWAMPQASSGTIDRQPGRADSGPATQQAPRRDVLILCPTAFAVRNVLHSRLLPELERHGLRAQVLVRPGDDVPGAAGTLLEPRFRGRGWRAALVTLDTLHRGAFFARNQLNSDRLTMWWYRHGEPWHRRTAMAALGRLGSLCRGGMPYRALAHGTSWVRERGWDSAAHRAELEARRPAVVMATSGINALEEPYMMAAAELGIPTIGCIQSFDHLTDRSRLIACDEYAVWNERMRGQLLAYHRPDAAGHVTITGTAQFDFHRQPQFCWDRAATLRHLGLDPDDRYILFAANTYFQTPSEPALVAEFLRRCAAIPELARHRMVVRLHPLDDFSRWDGLTAAHPRVALSLPSGKSEQFSSADEQARLISSLTHADVSINMWSSMSLDSAALDTPVVCVAFSGAGRGPEQRFCRDAYGADFYQPIVDSGGIRLAGDMDALVRETAEAVATPGRDRAARARLAATECGPLDGGNAARIAELVHSVASQRAIGTAGVERDH